MRRANPREARRMMQRFGMNVDEIPDANKVIIQTDRKEVIIDSPQVSIIEMQGKKVFQIAGGRVTERELSQGEETNRNKIPDEDVQLVANQTNSTLDEAKRALEETKGDLAKAVLLLQSKR